MGQDRYRRMALWMIVLALIALVWAAPAGVGKFPFTPWPTRIYYGVLSLGGIALLVCGGWLLYLRKLDHRVVLAGCLAALALGVNQTTGLVFNTILCFSAG